MLAYFVWCFEALSNWFYIANWKFISVLLSLGLAILNITLTNTMYLH
jgi:hypothetical protein